MTDLNILDGRRDASGGYKVDISRGERIGRVSSEWFSRPDDERLAHLRDKKHPTLLRNYQHHRPEHRLRHGLF